jgi:hypothetical protein
MPIYNLGLSETTARHLDRYVTEKILEVISKSIDKKEWADDPILLLATYQNELRAGIKDLGILHNRHTEQLAEIYNIIDQDFERAKTRLEANGNPVKLLEDRIFQLEKQIQELM